MNIRTLRADISFEEFSRYWHDIHGPIGARIRGLRRLVQSVAIRDLRDSHAPSFDGMAELWFDDIDAVLRARSSPEWQASTTDEPHFIDHRRTAYFLSHERTLVAKPPITLNYRGELVMCIRIAAVRLAWMATIVLGNVLNARAPCTAQQIADSAFAPPIAAPEYQSGVGPSVLIDAAHRNFHTAGGRYLAFARLLERDGYAVESNNDPFTAAVLDRADILVISNAMHEQSAAGFAPLPNLSAFSAAEVAAVEAWVRAGGSLMLIADHMPIAGHTELLAAAFGLRFQNGFAFDSGGGGRATFRRSDGSLPSIGVIDGRSSAERVDSVTTFTGQAFRVDPDVDADPLLVLPEGFVLLLPQVAWEFSESTPRISAAYLLQGALVRHGQGRIAAFGEAAMFSAQLGGPQRRPMGMNDPSAGQNYRFALNVMHWLSGRLP